MNPIKKFVKNIKGIFIKTPFVLKLNNIIGIIQPTKTALENNTIDKFNKVIIIRDGVEILNNEIRWGKILNEYPYSEERVKAINQIYQIPIVEKKFDKKIEFFQEPDFGSVENLI